MPNFYTQLESLVKAFAKSAIAGFPMANDEEKERRTKICSECPLMQPKDFKCGVCGCYLRYKISMATEKCPNNPDKWKIENNDNTNV